VERPADRRPDSGFCFGLILAFQSAIALSRYGAELFVRQIWSRSPCFANWGR
jgi:hypothetical protein